MTPLINAVGSAPIQNLIDLYYPNPLVHGVALGAHGEFISLYRSEFGKDTSINDILSSGKMPRDWSLTCERAKGLLLSPIYVAIYVDMDPAVFRSQYNVPEYTQTGNHLIIIERKGPFLGFYDHGHHRPITGGISVGNAGHSNSGTLAGFVQDGPGGSVYLLSCNHVLQHPTQTDVLQQGVCDGGTVGGSLVGSVFRAPTLTVSTAFNYTAPYYKVDYALADISGTAYTPRVRIVGAVSSLEPLGNINLGDDLVFVGKESDRRECRVYRLVARAKVDLLRNGSYFNFGDIFEIESRAYMYVGTLAQPGDSGAMVVREAIGTATANRSCGILFAGVGTFALCCFMETVLDDLNNPVGSFALA